mgnify:CR=1 FL=1
MNTSDHNAGQSARARWSKHLARWERSGQTQRAYCEANGLSLSSLRGWRHRLARERLWAPVRTWWFLAGFKMQAGLRQHWRDGGADEADAGQASELGVSLRAVALALDQNGLDVVEQTVEQG